MDLVVGTLPNGRWKENCYLLVNEKRDTLIIDPGGEADCIIDAIEQAELRPLAVLNTHGHFDHMGAVEPLQRRFDLPFYLHSADEKILRSANLYMKFFDGERPVSIPKVDHLLDNESNPIEIGEFKVQVLFTPGHTPGSVCLGVQDILFTGDTLFKGKVGRVDLPGGDLKTLAGSLKSLRSVNPKARIYPGHGQPSTLGEEAETNEAWKQTQA